MTPAYIRTLRVERCQLSLQQAARACGVHFTSIARWEAGKAPVFARYVVRLCVLAHRAPRPTRPCETCGGSGVQP
jgi:hypothetical protein